MHQPRVGLNACFVGLSAWRNRSLGARPAKNRGSLGRPGLQRALPHIPTPRRWDTEQRRGDTRRRRCGKVLPSTAPGAVAWARVACGRFLGPLPEAGTMAKHEKKNLDKTKSVLPSADLCTPPISRTLSNIFQSPSPSTSRLRTLHCRVGQFSLKLAFRHWGPLQVRDGCCSSERPHTVHARHKCGYSTPGGDRPEICTCSSHTRTTSIFSTHHHPCDLGGESTWLYKCAP